MERTNTIDLMTIVQDEENNQNYTLPLRLKRGLMKSKYPVLLVSSRQKAK